MLDWTRRTFLAAMAMLPLAGVPGRQPAFKLRRWYHLREFYECGVHRLLVDGRIATPRQASVLRTFMAAPHERQLQLDALWHAPDQPPVLRPALVNVHPGWPDDRPAVPHNGRPAR